MTTHTYAPKRLYLMQVATAPAPMNTPYVCYLVQTHDGKNILIDSGLPAQLPSMPGRPLPELGKDVLEQLALLDLQPGDIDTVICTHFDADHCGHNADFPNAQLVVQRAHYDTARAGHQRFANQRALWDLPASRYRLLDGDTTLLPGLELIETSGHVPGHQSVLVRLPETGPVLLTIDAVTTQGGFTPDRQATPMDLDGPGAIASTRKLLDVAQREHVALTIFGHDAKQWAELKKVPEYYE